MLEYESKLSKQQFTETKPSKGQAPVLELCEIWTSPSLALFTGPL